MRRDITNNQLYALEQDIQQQMNTSPAFYFFNSEKIKRFYSINAMALKILNQKMDGFVKKYVAHDEEEKPKTEQKEGRLVYVFNNEEDEKSYLTDTQEFLNRSVKVEL